MRGSVRFCGVMVTLTALLTVAARAQYPEDALRLALPGPGIGARAMGMGNAYAGVATDYSATIWNPAGLVQAQYGELFGGISYQKLDDLSTFFGVQETATSSSTTVNAFGIVYPFPVVRGACAVAFGYSRRSNFNAGVSFSGFNPYDSYIQSWAPDGQSYPPSLDGNIAYQLYLADIDTATGRWISPIKNRTTQRARISEGGGLNNWSLAAAVDVAKNVSLGATVHYISGSYKYDRGYVEEDSGSLYETFPYDFAQLTVDDYIDGQIYGWEGKFGLMFRQSGFFRLGFTVTTPAWFAVEENYGTEAQSRFDNGDIQPSDGEPFATEGGVRYEVVTPWVFGVGGSVILGPLVIAGDAEFTDWKTLEFQNAPPDVMDLNRDMPTIFRPTWNLRVGAELDLWVRLRAGAMYYPSQYEGDDASFDRKFVTGGLGIPLAPSAMLDIAYARGWWNTFRINDGGVSETDEQITSHTLIATLVIRF